jgi:hypothetical protein
MSTTRIKEKISRIVGSQLPEFIQSDYPTFISFLEAYYEFIEQDQGAFELLQNARSYNDIDLTIPSFVQYFLNTYAQNISASLLVDKKLLVKKIKDLYEAKGSELSFKLLFRILFDKSVSIRYPYENVLRASGGSWQQKLSIRVETISGDRNNLTNKTLTYVSNSVLYNTTIVETKILTSTLTELFLNPNQAAPFYGLEDTVEVYNNSTLIFKGRIKPTITGYSIKAAGTGFKVGQIFTVNFSGGVGTLIKVTEVTPNKGIQKLQFINYGYGYPSDFNIELDATRVFAETSDVITSITQGFGSQGTLEIISAYNPSSPLRYFDTDYVITDYTGISDFRYFNNSTYSAPQFTAVALLESTASINFTLGSLGKYPGSYFKNDSFLSEADVRLEDDKLYQPFAYLTNTEVDLNDFFTIVKSLVHPAGQNLFNNRLINLDFDFSSNVALSPESNVFFEARSTVVVGEAENRLMLKNVDAVENIALPSDDDVLEVIKPISDSVTEIDFEVKTTLKPLIVDAATTSDTVLLLQVAGRFFTEDVIISDPYGSRLDKVINNTDSLISVTDNGSVAVSGTADPNRYFDEDFVIEIYTMPSTVEIF